MSIVNDLIDNDDNNSVNSSSISNSNGGGGGGLKEKYERLVQEYTKQKNKLNVVKKAYLELNENSKEKDQLIRKTEQEIESLNFRNKQLVTRITILQSEVDKLHQQVNVLQSNGDSKQSLLIHNNSPTNGLNILKEELQSKINENAQLHTKLNDLEMENRQMIAEHEAQCKQLFREKSDLEETLKKHEFASRTLVDELCGNKKSLETRIGSLERELESVKQQQNSVEVVGYDLNDLYNLYNDTLSCLNKVYTFVDERMQLLSSSSSSRGDEKKIMKTLILLCENSQPVNSIAEFFEHFLKLLALNQQFLVDYLAHGVQNQNEEEELKHVENSSNVKSELNSLNSSLKTLLHVLVLHLNELVVLVNDLFSGGKRALLNKSDFETVANFIAKFYANFKQLLQIFNEKLTLEHLKCTNSHDLITIDECINSYLNEFYLLIEKFKKIFNQNINTLLKSWNSKLIQTPATAVAPTSGDGFNLIEKINSLKENERKLQIELDVVKEKWNNDVRLLTIEIKELKARLEEQDAAVTITKLVINESVKTDETDTTAASGASHHDTMLKTHYENEIIELKYQLFLADGKATYYYQEVEYLSENIKFIINELNQEKGVNAKQGESLNDLNEELDMTRQRYEDQIRTMSEHIASMNDRLTEQAEEIEKLNHFIKNINNSNANSGKQTNKKK